MGHGEISPLSSREPGHLLSQLLVAFDQQRLPLGGDLRLEGARQADVPLKNPGEKGINSAAGEATRNHPADLCKSICDSGGATSSSSRSEAMNQRPFHK